MKDATGREIISPLDLLEGDKALTKAVLTGLTEKAATRKKSMARAATLARSIAEQRYFAGRSEEAEWWLAELRKFSKLID